MIAVAVFGGFLIGVGVCLVDILALRRKLAAYRETNGWQGEEIVGRKFADWLLDKHYLKTGDQAAAFDVEAET